MFEKMTFDAYSLKLKREIMGLIDSICKTPADDEDYLPMTRALDNLMSAYEKFSKLVKK